jgi:MSHA biogenesis protein MshJ
MKAQLTPQVKQWAERIDARTLRERLLIFAMAALVLVTLVTTLALDPAQARRKLLQQQLTEQQARIAASQAQIQALVAARSTDPDAANRARLAALKDRIAASDAKLASFQQGLVSSDRMAAVLHDLLSRNRALKLVSLRTLPVRTLMDEVAKPAATAKVDDPKGAIYKHGVEVTVEGSYGDLLAYTAELEAMPWQVFWGGANLSVQTYPVSRLTLTLYTMSLDKAWLRV